MRLAVDYLENMTKVSRFDMIIMCLSSPDRAGMYTHIYSLEVIEVIEGYIICTVKDDSCLNLFIFA